MERPPRGRRRRATDTPKMSKKDRTHPVNFGTYHPANDRTSESDRVAVAVSPEAAADDEESSHSTVDSGSESDDAVCQLLNTFHKRRPAIGEESSDIDEPPGSADQPQGVKDDDASEQSAAEDEEQEQENPIDVTLTRSSSKDSLWLKGSLAVPDTLTPLQMELLSVLTTYRDLLFTERTLANGEEVRTAYCLHALNHVLKSLSRVLHHNARLHRGASSEMRDQGLTRPQVLFLMPFRESALRTVKLLAQLLPAKDVAHVSCSTRSSVAWW